jgi:predicted TIM-barrel fold metal-dependent hydrolase
MLLAERDTAGVSRVVIVPPSWEGDRNDLGLAAARLHPKRFAVMGRLAIERPESRALVAHWKKQPRRAARHRRAPPRAERCPFRDLHAHFRRLVDAFGPRRTFWGTDLTRMPCSYRACVNLFTQELPWLEGDDLEWVMGRGVCEWLGWP